MASSFRDTDLSPVPIKIRIENQRNMPKKHVSLHHVYIKHSTSLSSES